MWQIGEFMALASLGGKAQKVNRQKYSGAEFKISYGANPQQYIMLFPPIAPASARDSIVFFVHGGGWNMGSPTLYRFVGRFFAQLGYPTILAGYRLTPDYKFPAQLEDASTSLRTGIDYFVQHDIPVKRIILGGHSAGAQLASLLIFDEEVMKTERSLFLGLFCISGVLDFSFCQSSGIKKLLGNYIGNLANPEIADPIFFANPALPVSVLCLHGAKDPLVNVMNSKSFTQKLNQGEANRAQLTILPNNYHSDTLNLFLEMTDDAQVLTEWIRTIETNG